MQAIMLAAGKGSRLGKLTKNNTKCMLEINGISLLERTIIALKKAKINKLILVVGYKADNLKKYIKDKKLDKKIDIEYVENKDYDTTNNIYSLYLAKDYFYKDDTILLESDIIYDENLIKELIKSDYENAVVVSKYQQWMDGTVVTIDEDDNITEFIEKANFDYGKIDNYYKTVNIYKFSKEYLVNYYLPFLRAYIEAYGKNDYYELVLKVISSISKSGLKAYKLNDELWYEIDDCQDYDIATVLFSKEEKMKLYQKRFGGYWRFEGLKDYCYLVNPYFPNKLMLDKIKYYFSELITQYPSTMNIECNCLSRFFNVSENKILVGNGAAELINNLKYVIKGKVAVFVPTFNEYVRCFPDNEMIKIDTSKFNYKIDKELALSCLDLADCLVIINPDNPSGNFIKFKDLIEIIEKYNNKDKKIIIDESFIDFSDESLRYTLIDDEILDKYKNLIVIKSISKSYGVPGLRLGVLASSDKLLLQTIKNNMPVWNINSFAEYFLQIFVPFKKYYISSCNKISDIRKELINELRKIKFLKVYESQANYIMLKLKNVSSYDLSQFFLEKYNILIKDLSSKEGFNNGNFIRIAVKTPEENSIILEALKNYERTCTKHE